MLRERDTVLNKYLIIDASEINKIDFTQTVITSEQTLRFSIDRSKAIIEWDQDEPTFLPNLSYKDGPYEAEEIRNIIATPEWQLLSINLSVE